MMFVAVLPERDILIREMQVSPCAGFFGWLLDAARLLMGARRAVESSARQMRYFQIYWHASQVVQ